MKLLHTSDWHLGRVTYNASRAEDHDLAISQIADHARTLKPDLIVHSGDLFDGVRPAYVDLARGITALQELAVIAPVVVICGNHDSPALFDVLAQLLGPESRIKLVSRARLPEAGGILCFPTADDEIIRLAPLPFVHANRMLDGFEDPRTWSALYADRIHNVEDALARGLFDGFDMSRDVAVFAAHLYVGGAVLSGSERRIHIGDSYASRLEHLPPVTYAAFGHIHKPQPLPSSAVTGAYAGSPIQLDFGELGEEKRVVFVEARAGQPAEITSLPMSAGRPLWRFEGSLEELAKIAPAVGDVLGLVTIHSPKPSSDLHAQVGELLSRATVLQVYEVAANRRLATALAQAPDGEATLDEMFRDYLSSQGTRGAAADRVMSTFETLLAAVEAEQQAAFPEEDDVTAARTSTPPPDGPGDASGFAADAVEVVQP
jgi:exonuclease SbcD